MLSRVSKCPEHLDSLPVTLQCTSYVNKYMVTGDFVLNIHGYTIVRLKHFHVDNVQVKLISVFTTPSMQIANSMKTLFK